MPDIPERERSAARLALDAFGVPGDAALEFIKHRENHVYRVRAPGIDRALRMHRVGYRSDEELRAETAAIETFGAGGIQVPAPVRTPQGEHVAVVFDEGGERRQATMQHWIDGGRGFADSGVVFEGGDRPAADDLSALGELIARMHDIASRDETDYRRPAWNAAGLTGSRSLWGPASRLRTLDAGERELLDAAERRLADELAGLATTSDRFGMIHADFTFENVLRTDRGLTALDFDDSGAGWYLFDLATPYFWCTRHPDAEEALAALIAGYRRARPITPEDERAWHPLLLARGLSYLGWAADRPGDPTSGFHEEVVAPWVLAAARRYLEVGHTGWPSLTADLTRSEGAR